MTRDDSPRTASVKHTVSILNQVADKLHDNDPVSAQVMVGVAIQILENLKTDLESHLATEKMLRQLMSQKSSY
ncbi:hypothetical protein [Pantanalinema sp. GBBB05]|uniref:hypothetical protein n=1 Tax=Pantanalinema sp. GBBB05 TaxID=2604139 RepID=UPI001DB6FF61|nr:hypothetical protein [Pantanalinema sp. GBBB05]